MKVNQNYIQRIVNRSTARMANRVKASIDSPYTPRNYCSARDLADVVYDNTGGTAKFLMWLNKNNGENLNNTVTAVGTTGVAPFFIALNPFSKEDKNSKYYTALRQPISAIVTLGTQLFVMSNYNNWIYKHAAYLGVDEMDLRAKPPEAVLFPRAKGDYAAYYSDCLKNGVDPVNKKKWISGRIRQLQDEAFYDTLSKMRADADNLNIKLEDVVKLDLLDKKRNECFKEVLKNNYGFSDSELESFKDFKDLLKKNGKNACKAKSLDYNLVRDSIDREAMKRAVSVVDQSIDMEAKVKLLSSKYKLQLEEQLNDELLQLKSDVIAQKSRSLNNAKTPNCVLKDEVAQIKDRIYKEFLAKLKPDYDIIMTKSLSDLTEDDKVAKHTYEKLLKYVNEPIDGIKFHGHNLEQARKSVIIKKYLINKINKSQAKLQGWKNRSGMIVGLIILPATCGLLNWVYPKVMSHYFPKLSEAKAAAKAKKYDLEFNNTNNVKEAN